MRPFLDAYGQWVLTAACIASLMFAVAATLFEGSLLRPWTLRTRWFPWWRHELTLAQVVLDLCLFVVLLPSALYTVAGIDFLRARSGSLVSLWYYALGLTFVALATLWRTDAMMRAKNGTRRKLAAVPPPERRAS